jgi:hypothetical protein
MADDIFRQVSKNAWYRVSLYVNIILFFVVAVFIYFLVTDCIEYGKYGGEVWLRVTRDIAFISVGLALIFFQFIRNLYTILRRSL